jgi:hypothetical protein
MNEMEGLALTREGNHKPAGVPLSSNSRHSVGTWWPRSVAGGRDLVVRGTACWRNIVSVFIEAGSKLGNEYRLFRRLAGTTWWLLLGDGLSGGSLNRSCKS